LDLDCEKLNFLRQIHRLPRSAGNEEVLVALKEKSALLVFSD
jgi:hypothetical protein